MTTTDGGSLWGCGPNITSLSVQPLKASTLKSASVTLKRFMVHSLLDQLVMRHVTPLLIQV
jgi:hypothetical protein